VAFIAYPVCKWLESKRWKRSLAITAVIFLVALLFLFLLMLLIYDLNIFLRDLPLITNKLKTYAPGIQHWVMDTAGINFDTQLNWFNTLVSDLQNGLSGYLKSLFNATVSTVFMLVMIPIYASLFLYHRETFVKYLRAVIEQSYHKELQQILQRSILTYFHFIKGTFFVYLIVGALNSIGLLLLGIPHAILYGMLTAFMTIIPYIGILISASMPVTVALITKDSLWYPVGVISLFTIVQYLEANVIFPRVVAAQLNLSTWSTLVAIIAGTLLWGVAGMILFIPMLAIFKIVSDQVEGLKSINILLNRKEGYHSATADSSVN
jgi:predicted PurR-regulated permease PerM